MIEPMVEAAVATRRTLVTLSRLAAALVLLLAGCSSGQSRHTTAPTASSTAAPHTTTGGAATGTGPGGACPAGPLPSPPSRRPRYQLSVDLRAATAGHQVPGRLRVAFTPDLPTDQLVFRLWPNSPTMAKAGARLQAGPVTVVTPSAGAASGTTLQSTQPDPTTLVVRLGSRLAAGSTVEVELPWRLTLPGAVRERVSAAPGGALRLGSFFPLLAWEPGVGWATDPPPTIPGEASTSPTADFDVTVTAPAGLQVLASGVPDGHGHWKATAMRDFALSAGHFRLAAGTAYAPGPVRVTVGIDSAVVEASTTYLAKAIRVLQDYARRFGPYPWPAFTMALTPNLGGGIEYPGHVMLGPGTLGPVTSHEIGHQWFYALVGNDQGRDPWLDEGLASYAEARFDGALGYFQHLTIPAEARGHLGEPMRWWSTHGTYQLYFAGVYAQGVQALAALGDPALVDCALRVYVAREAYRLARPADLIGAAATVVPRAATVMAGFGVR